MAVGEGKLKENVADTEKGGNKPALMRSIK